jgi:hypothetical protein
MTRNRITIGDHFRVRIVGNRPYLIIYADATVRDPVQYIAYPTMAGAEAAGIATGLRDGDKG